MTLTFQRTFDVLVAVSFWFLFQGVVSMSYKIYLTKLRRLGGLYDIYREWPAENDKVLPELCLENVLFKRGVKKLIVAVVGTLRLEIIAGLYDGILNAPLKNPNSTCFNLVNPFRCWQL